ncbi:HTH-type transcriptional regulator GbpR [Pigmentiphaga humi]|uniref:HTH-type transcriptional regulator GbpR n=1 Tax=Pigmentiphaga humi TaxID=2478468 RepID=A0A3P4AZP8_9BURK|nr:LysR substrate-binding domain-containing protein [Pigmentiphaga humi]VCU69537.1 HTH-type transcriptional regulator GbpR [Pigmentiphaga humi]
MAKLDWYIRANLKPRHLQLLVALDELRNLGKVAVNLNVTQPAVSLALSELEKGLGFKLFDRTARGVQPNAYGECMIRQARTMLSTLAQTRDELRALQSGASGRTALGAMPAMTSALVPHALAALKRISPTTSVQIHEGSMDTLLPDLRRGNLDVLVGRLSSRPSADFAEEELFGGASQVVVGCQHPLAGAKQLHWRDLGKYPWVLPPTTSLPREPLEATFQEHGIPIPRDTIETVSVPVIASYLRSTEAVGLLSPVAARHYCGLGMLVVLPLELRGLLRPIGLTWSKQHALSPASELLMRCLREVSSSLKH